jgi:hypothetical protein
MRPILVPVLGLALVASGAAYAQSSSTPSSTASPQTSAATQQNHSKNLLTANKLKQNLQNAGFSDVRILADAFVVQAKDKSGNPVVMTFSPFGMEAVEAINLNGAKSGTTGSGSGAMSSGSHDTSSSSASPASKTPSK